MEKGIFEIEINPIKEKMIIELRKFWGRSKYPGYRGTILTKDKELYKYQCYFLGIPDSSNEDGIYIKKIKVLSDEDFEKITEFIQNELIDKEYEFLRRYDETYTLSVNYNGIEKVITNDTEIYNMTDEFLNSMIDN